MVNLRDLLKRLRGIDNRIRRLERLEGGTTNLVNNSGGKLSPGDVVVIDPTVENSVRMALGANAAAPCVVVIGGENEDLVKVTKRGYGKITITCDGVAIVPGYPIATSATNGRGAVAPVIWGTAWTMLGVALESKAAGVGSVLVLV